jgi:tRNA A-37 threonylcarbamoyl transferase component Bud32
VTPGGNLLQRNGLDNFETIWSLDAPWVEEPNFRRQGWSGVCRLTLDKSEGQPVVYLKRQENHGYRSLLSPLRLRPTAFREYTRLKSMEAAAVAAPEVLYYGERHTGKALQAILITKEVPQSIAFEDYLRLSAKRPASEVGQVLRDTARLIGRLHRHRIQHCALYGKHVLISGYRGGNPTTTSPEQRLVPYLIDVEKARRKPSRISIARRDLNQFFRHAPWTEAQWETFLDHYVIACRMKRMRPLLARMIQRKARRKQSRRRASEKQEAANNRHEGIDNFE